jgi:polygalacturonase
MLAAASPSMLVNVREHGAAGDGQRLDTAAINAAAADCSRPGSDTVYLPPGRYLTGTIEWRSRVTLALEAGATILGSENPDDYPPTPSLWGDGREVMAPLIYAADADNITITGRGAIDGQGAIWWRR